MILRQDKSQYLQRQLDIYNGICIQENSPNLRVDLQSKEHGEPVPWAFRNVRVHDLKHTFGRRLRAAGVGLAWASQWSHRDALLSGRTHELDRSFRKGVRRRVPQNSRNDLASAQDRLAK
jgi:hypothetical protein